MRIFSDEMAIKLESLFRYEHNKSNNSLCKKFNYETITPYSDLNLSLHKFHFNFTYQTLYWT